MNRDDIIENVKDAKFQIEFMALMLLSDRTDEAATAYEKALAKLSEIVAADEIAEYDADIDWFFSGKTWEEHYEGGDAQ